MLRHPTFDQLGLAGMAHAFADFDANPHVAGLGHAEWLALLLDHEATWRNNRRLALRLRHAKLRHHAVPEDVDYRAARGLVAGCSSCCSGATGSPPTKTARSSGQQGWAKVGWPAPSATRPAVTTARFFTPACRA